MKRYDVVVIGCGAMGSSLSYHLASRGMSTLVLERFAPNHKFGSSHGSTRIIRTAYAEDPAYVPLVKEAFSLWRELEAKSGKKILKMTGGMMVGSRESGLIQGVLESARVHGLPHSVMTGKDAADRFGIFSFDESQAVVYEEQAGVLFPENCIAAHVELARNAGADFRFNERLTRWSAERGTVVLETPRGSYEAGRVVFAAGAWLPGLVRSLSFLTVERQVLFWFRVPGAGYAPGEMPIFMMEEANGGMFYGIPDFGEGVKVAGHHGGQATLPDEVSRVVTKSDKEPVQQFIRARMKGLSPEPTSSATCLYTNTPDGDFIIDLLPGDDRVLVVSPCSGHGFKFASVVGRLGADLITKGSAGQDLEFVSLRRFQERKPGSGGR